MLSEYQNRNLSGISVSDTLIEEWTKEQVELATQVIEEDQNTWHNLFRSGCFSKERELFIAGADISFSTAGDDSSIATITIVKLETTGEHKLVYSKSKVVRMTHPYIPSFLGFREAPIISDMLMQLPQAVRQRIDCILVDGNGVLHPKRAGLACHVGVKDDIPCIGVSKALLCVDGLDEKQVREHANIEKDTGYFVKGKNGALWGAALMTGNAQNKPIYVSIGHRVALQTAAALVRTLCEFRVPSPIRFADLHSRACLRGEKTDLFKSEEFLHNDSTK